MTCTTRPIRVRPGARRREVLGAAVAAPLGAWLGCGSGGGLTAGSATRGRDGTPRFEVASAALQAKWDAALAGLERNVRRVFRFDRPVLVEGEGYAGIWLECGPHESLVYASFTPEVARASHEIFFRLQREDGYLPCYVRENQVGTSQIQMVVPIAATALELFTLERDEAFLRLAYDACARWDAWLRKHRNTRGTGLVEAFCGYDTGHDHSPRFAGLPWKCPEDDARLCPHVGNLPYLAPDLSATTYGGRVALARMAKLLGKAGEEAQWLERADEIRKAVVKTCLDPVDVFFYDVDKNDRFVRIKTDALSRVLGEHVPDQALAHELWRRHVRNPDEFWTSYPFPSIAANDAEFDTKMGKNSWGGPSQALTALRAPRWMDHYGKSAELVHVLGRWLKALVAAPEFHQQMDPFTGHMSTSRNYSPAMLVLVDAIARLFGVRRAEERLEWTCRRPEGAGSARYALHTSRGVAEILHDGGGARLRLGGRELLKVEGAARVRTNLDGQPEALVGVEMEAAAVAVTGADGKRRTFTVAPNAVVAL